MLGFGFSVGFSYRVAAVASWLLGRKGRRRKAALAGGRGGETRQDARLSLPSSRRWPCGARDWRTLVVSQTGAAEPETPAPPRPGLTAPPVVLVAACRVGRAPAKYPRAAPAPAPALRVFFVALRISHSLLASVRMFTDG